MAQNRLAITDPAYRAYIRSVPIEDLDASLDAFAAEHPAEAAWRAGWAERCDRAALGSLRRRHRSGEAARDLAVLDARAAHIRARPAPPPVPEPLPTRGASPTARASAYLARCPSAVSGQGRSEAVWRAVLLAVRGFCLGEAEAMTVLLAPGGYAARAQPPVGERELRGVVRRALRATTPPWGWALHRGGV